MEIIAISSIIGIVAFAIGIFCGKSSPCHHEIYCDLNNARFGNLGALETKVYMLESENQRLQCIYESLSRKERYFHEYMMAHCSKCDRTFYAKTPKEQEIADLLKTLDTGKTVEELAKKLDIKIR